MRITVRKVPPSKGSWSVLQQRNKRYICVDKKPKLTVDYAPAFLSWYWYGNGINTLLRSLCFSTRDEAIEHAKAFLREQSK